MFLKNPVELLLVAWAKKICYKINEIIYKRRIILKASLPKCFFNSLREFGFATDYTDIHRLNSIL